MRATLELTDLLVHFQKRFLPNIFRIFDVAGDLECDAVDVTLRIFN